MPKMPYAERLTHKYAVAQPFAPLAGEHAKPDAQQLAAASAAATSFNVVLQGGGRNTHVYFHKDRKGKEYAATNALSKHQHWLKWFTPTKHDKAHAKTRARVLAMYEILSRDESRPEVAAKAQRAYDVIMNVAVKPDGQWHLGGVGNTEALRRASKDLAQAIKKYSQPQQQHVALDSTSDPDSNGESDSESLSPTTFASTMAAVVSLASPESARPPLPEAVKIGTSTMDPQTGALQADLRADTLSLLRDYVQDLPNGCVLMQYGGAPDDPSVYVGARRAEDPVSEQDRDLNTDLEQDFAETLKLLAEAYMDHSEKWADAYFVIKLANTHLKDKTPITVTWQLRQNLNNLCGKLPDTTPVNQDKPAPRVRPAVRCAQVVNDELQIDPGAALALSTYLKTLKGPCALSMVEDPLTHEMLLRALPAPAVPDEQDPARMSDTEENFLIFLEAFAQNYRSHQADPKAQDIAQALIDFANTLLQAPQARPTITAEEIENLQKYFEYLSRVAVPVSLQAPAAAQPSIAALPQAKPSEGTDPTLGISRSSEPAVPAKPSPPRVLPPTTWKDPKMHSFNKLRAARTDYNMSTAYAMRQYLADVPLGVALRRMPDATGTFFLASNAMSHYQPLRNQFFDDPAKDLEAYVDHLAGFAQAYKHHPDTDVQRAVATLDALVVKAREKKRGIDNSQALKDAFAVLALQGTPVAA